MLLDIPAMIVGEDRALVDGSGEHTYAGLREAVARAAGLLSRLGVEPGDRVAVLSTNSNAVVEVLFAAAARGATAVPMNFRAKEEELAHLLADSGARVLFVESRYLDAVGRVHAGHLRDVVVLDDPEGYPAAQIGRAHV